MPAYRFDIVDDDKLIPAEDSFELADHKEARDQAMRAVGSMMAEALPNGDSKRLKVIVRRDDGRAILTVELTLASQWHLRDGG